MVTSFKGLMPACPAAPRTVEVSASDSMAGHCRPTPPAETPGDSQANLPQSLVGSLLLSPGSWCTQGFVCALQECFPSPVEVRWSKSTGLQSKVPWEFSVPLLDPQVEESVVGLRTLQQCENFFNESAALNMPVNLENSAVATGLEKVSFHSCLKATSRNLQTTTQWYSSHTLAKWCSKFSRPGFNSTWNVNFQKFKLDLEKGEEPEIKLPTSVGSSKNQESSRKISTSALLTTPKPLTV